MFRSMMIVTAVWAACFAAPASASCTRPIDTPLPHATVTLTSPDGKQVARTTDGDGVLSMRGLKRGVWDAKLDGEKHRFTLHIGRDGKLRLKAAVQSYSCSPPGGPVHHAQIKSVVQLNPRKMKAKP